MPELIDTARALLEEAGVPVGEGDLELLAMVSQSFGAAMQALDDAELAQLPLEPDLDPSRPPHRTP
jgi:hypothetical protein